MIIAIQNWFQIPLGRFSFKDLVFVGVISNCNVIGWEEIMVVVVEKTKRNNTMIHDDENQLGFRLFIYSYISLSNGNCIRLQFTNASKCLIQKLSKYIQNTYQQPRNETFNWIKTRHLIICD